MSQEAKELSSQGHKFHTIQLLTKKELARPLLIAIVIQVAQQWSGINAVSSGGLKMNYMFLKKMKLLMPIVQNCSELTGQQGILQEMSFVPKYSLCTDTLLLNRLFQCFPL